MNEFEQHLEEVKSEYNATEEEIETLRKMQECKHEFIKYFESDFLLLNFIRFFKTENITTKKDLIFLSNCVHISLLDKKIERLEQLAEMLINRNSLDKF